MKLLRKKYNKTQGHIEMILSFTIFLGFLLVMFIFINPLRENRVSYTSLDEVENIVLSNLSIDYQHIALILESGRPNTNCFSVYNNFSLNSSILVVDENENIVASLNDVSSKKINIEPQSKDTRLYRIYFSNNLISSASPSSCKDLKNSDYGFGVLTSENSVLAERLVWLNQTYWSNYSLLKSNLNLNKNFEFVIYNLNQSKVLFDTTAFHKVKTSEVLARDVPLRIINSSGAKSDILFNLRTW